MRFVQPIRLGHVTSHMSTNLHQLLSSTLFTTTTTGLPQHPCLPHHHLHEVSKHGYNSQNTPATMPHHHDTPRTQTDHNGLKTRRMQLETEQRAQGKEGEHTKDKGWGHTRYACHFFYFITFTSFCFSQTGSPSAEHQIHTPLDVFWCLVASPTF